MGPRRSGPFGVVGGVDGQRPSVHVVEPGETLYALARRYKVSVAALAETNGVSQPAGLRAGQQLQIPSGGLLLAELEALPHATVAAEALAERIPEASAATPRKILQGSHSAAAPVSPPAVFDAAAIAAVDSLVAPLSPPAVFDAAAIAAVDSLVAPLSPPVKKPELVALAPASTAVRDANAPLKPHGLPANPALTLRAPPLPHKGAHGQLHLQWPVSGTITSRFGRRRGRAHDGIDIGAPVGSQVRAAADGDVVFSDTHRGYGNVVILRHVDGLMTIYAHHQKNLVLAGQHVRQGDPIAQVGSTGRATGPHLHFEVRRRAQPRNPLHFLPKT